MLITYTKDDYLKFSGVDLDIEFKNGNYDAGVPADIVINQVHDDLVLYMSMNFGFDGVLKNETQKEGFKKALNWQIYFVLKNSLLSQDSDNKNKTISPNTYASLKVVGLANLNCVYIGR